jgi:hypothetical protein
MPARLPTVNPSIIAGTVFTSGDANTGQIPFTLGGSRVVTKYSGVVGPDVVAYTGGGRLDAAFFHDSAILALSGQAVVFYDASVAVSGGPFAADGHKVLGVLAPSDEQSATGISGAALRGGQVRNFGFTFQSGLAYSTRSGQPGFSASFTPVVSN